MGASTLMGVNFIPILTIRSPKARTGELLFQGAISGTFSQIRESGFRQSL